MKELKKYFEHYKQLYPNLSSFMWYGKACKQVKPNKSLIKRGFRLLVEKSDYSNSDYNYLILHLENMAQHSHQECRQKRFFALFRKTGI
jgi:hypothetical protein